MARALSAVCSNPGVALRHVADLVRGLAGRLAENLERAAGWLQRVDDGAHQRRLARAVGSEEADKFTGLDVGVDARENLMVAEDDAQVRNAKRGAHGSV